MKSTVRMVATLLLLTGVGWLTGALPWPFANTPPLQSASREVSPVAAADASLEPEIAPAAADVSLDMATSPAEETNVEAFIEEDDVLVDDTADEDESSSLGLFEEDFPDDSSDATDGVS